MRLHIGLLHTALYVDATKDILTAVKLVAAQTARISHTSQHPSSLHMKTKRLMMMMSEHRSHVALCCTSSTRVLERGSSSFLYARSVHVLQHSTIHYCILSDDRPTGSWNTVEETQIGPFVDCDSSPQCLSLRIEHCLFGGLSSSCHTLLSIFSE